MRKVREVLRLKHSVMLSEREIAGSGGIGKSTMGAYIKRAEEAELCWEQAEPMSDTEVEARLFALVGRNEPQTRWRDEQLANPRIAEEPVRQAVSSKLLHEASDSAPL